MSSEENERRNWKSLNSKYQRYILGGCTYLKLNRSVLALSTDLTKTWSVLGNGFREKGGGNASSRDGFGLCVSG